jgi:hypothetical protein
VDCAGERCAVMKRKKFQPKVHTTQKPKHAHPVTDNEVRELALKIMHRVIDSPGATADINEVTYDLGVRADDPCSWQLGNRAIALLVDGGALEITGYCEEHEAPHRVHAVAVFWLVPVVDHANIVQGLVCLRCAAQEGYIPDRDENGVIYGFRLS